MTNIQKILLAGMVVILTAVTSVSALLLTRAWDPLWNPFRPSPEQVLAQALKNSQDINATGVSAVFRLDFQKAAQSVFSVESQIQSETDATDPDNPRSQGTVDGSVGFEGIEVSFAAEYKLLEDTWYFKITTFPFLSYLQAFLGEEVSQLRDQWIAFDMEEILEEAEKVPEDREKEIQRKIEQLAQNNELFEEIEELGDETIRGASAYHYRVTLKESGLQEVLAIIEEEGIGESQDLSPAIPYATAQKSFEQEMAELFEKIGDVPIDVWIEKKTLLPARFAIEKNLAADADIFLSGLPTQFDNANIYLQVDFVSFGKPVQVTAPEDSATLEEVFSSIYVGKGPFDEARSSARDAKRQSAIRQIQIAEELYYNEHGAYPVTPISLESIVSALPRDPGGGVCEDYQWISNIANPQSYCVYACLEDGGFFVGSPAGTFKLPVPPPSLEACES